MKQAVPGVRPLPDASDCPLCLKFGKYKELPWAVPIRELTSNALVIPLFATVQTPAVWKNPENSGRFHALQPY